LLTVIPPEKQGSSLAVPVPVVPTSAARNPGWWIQQGIGLRETNIFTIVGTAGCIADNDFIIMTATATRLHAGSTLPVKGWKNVTKQKV
jgi:hypothetical protein